MNYKEEYKKWCEDQSFDEETREELLSIKDNEEEIKDRFYKELEFGTARGRWCLSRKWVGPMPVKRPRISCCSSIPVTEARTWVL